MSISIGRAAALAVAVIVLATPGISVAKQNGFGTEEGPTTQGNGGNTNDNSNPDNNGQVETETTGPRGQLKNGNEDCNNCTTTTTGPGNSN